MFSYTLPFTQPEFYVWTICIGFNIAMLISFIFKGVESKIVSELFKANALNENSAVALSSLDVWGLPIAKLLLRDNSTLRKAVLSVKTEKEPDAKSKLNFDTALFYINEEKIDRANALKKRSTRWYLLPIFCALSIGLAIGLTYVIPIFINW